MREGSQMQPFVRDLGESRGVELALYAESIIERKRHHISEMRDVTGPSRHVSCPRGRVNPQIAES